MTTGEAQTVEPQLAGVTNINVTDAVTVGEAVTLLLPFLLINSTDAAATGEDVTASIQVAGSTNASVNDDVTVVDAVTVAAQAATPWTVSVNDLVVVNESKTMLVPFLLADTTETIVTGEAVALIAEIAGVRQVNTGDSITVGEVVTAQIETIAALTVNAGDAVVTAEAIDFSAGGGHLHGQRR